MPITVKTTLKRGANQARAEKVTKASHKHLSRLWKDATRAYLRAAVVAMSADTGMSKASLIPLAREVKLMTEVRSGIINRVRSRKGSWDMSGNFNPKGKRTKALGIASNSKGSGYNYLLGSHKRPVFEFSFEITVYQFLVRNSNKDGKKAAWNAIEKGKAAFLEVIDRDFEFYTKNVLNLEKWLVGGR